jgi:hypothetical protein
MADDRQSSGYNFYYAPTSNNIKDDTPAISSPPYHNPNGNYISSARRIKYYDGTKDGNY